MFIQIRIPEIGAPPKCPTLITNAPFIFLELTSLSIVDLRNMEPQRHQVNELKRGQVEIKTVPSTPNQMPP